MDPASAYLLGSPAPAYKGSVGVHWVIKFIWNSSVRLFVTLKYNLALNYFLGRGSRVSIARESSSGMQEPSGGAFAYKIWNSSYQAHCNTEIHILIFNYFLGLVGGGSRVDLSTIGQRLGDGGGGQFEGD